MSEELKPLRALEFGIVPGGFAVAVAVWLTAFVCRLPMVLASPRVVFGLLIGVMLVGAVLVGWGAGRREVRGEDGSARRVIKRVVLTMLVAGLVNVLLVGSIVGAASVGGAGSAEGPGHEVNVITLSGLVWIPGSLIASGLFGMIGGGIGCLFRRSAGFIESRSEPVGSTARGEQAALALVTLVTTFCLILVGGVVTSAEAGLAVPDWPNSYGWNMFLFPFSRMVGGIYYEHAHRLIGSLVGLETLVLFVWLWRRRPRIGVSGRGLVWLGTLAFVLVCVQGVLGGARVFVVNQFGHDVALKLAVVHGFHAQLFLLTMAGLGWSLARGGQGTIEGARCGVVLRVLGRVFVIVILGQTLAGAVYRHLGGSEGGGGVGWVFPVHLAGAGVVFLLGMLQMGGVMMGLSGNSPAVMRVMRAVFTTFVIIAVQVALGFSAWWVTSRYDAFDQRTSDWMIYLTAGHVVCGAILLVAALWSMLEILHFREESTVSS